MNNKKFTFTEAEIISSHANTHLLPKLRHFKLLRREVEIAPLYAELIQKHAMFDASKHHYKGHDQQHTNRIYLRGAQKEFSNALTGDDVHASKWLAEAGDLPQIRNWLLAISDRLGIELSRAIIANLQAGKPVYPHFDHGNYYKIRHRHHLVLHSQKGSLLRAGGETIRMYPGELWQFNNKALHEAFNDSDEDRIHLIFDGIPPKMREIAYQHLLNHYERRHYSREAWIVRRSQKLPTVSCLEADDLAPVESFEALRNSTKDAILHLSKPQKITMQPINVPASQQHYLAAEGLEHIEYQTNPVFVAKFTNALLAGRRFSIITQRGKAVLETLPTNLYKPDLKWLDRKPFIRDDLLTHKVKTIDDPAFILCNNNWRNYWHWTMQCLPNLALLKQASPEGKVSPLIPPLKPWRDDSLRLHHGVGMAAPQKIYTEICRAREVYYPSYAWKHEQWKTDPEIIAYHRSISQKLAAEAGPVEGIGRKIYVARQDAPKVRPLTNEAELISALGALGIQAINPGDYCFAEQLRIFAHADFVIGAHGAGMTNLLYTPANACIIELFPHYYFFKEKLAYASLSMACGHHYSAFVSKEVDGEYLGYQQRNYNLPWSIDIDELTAFLRTLL